MVTSFPTLSDMFKLPLADLIIKLISELTIPAFVHVLDVSRRQILLAYFRAPVDFEVSMQRWRHQPIVVTKLPRTQKSGAKGSVQLQFVDSHGFKTPAKLSKEQAMVILEELHHWGLEERSGICFNRKMPICSTAEYGFYWVIRADEVVFSRGPKRTFTEYFFPVSFGGPLKDDTLDVVVMLSFEDPKQRVPKYYWRWGQASPPREIAAYIPPDWIGYDFRESFHVYEWLNYLRSILRLEKKDYFALYGPEPSTDRYASPFTPPVPPPLQNDLI